MTWRNWSGTVTASPCHLARPGSVEEVAATVRDAADRGLKVKAVGSGHSFTACAAAPEVMVRMDRMASILRADRSTGLVTVQAGVGLRRLSAGLAALGLAMENLGDIDRQTLSGAVSTGTHGTGAGLGGLAAQVTGLELVTADGSVVTCSATDNAEVFHAARVGVGALGVITALDLRCVPAFLLRAQEGPMALEEVLAGFDELADGNDHFEFYWFPHTTVALTKRNNRVDADVRPAPVGRVSGWISDELLSNRVFELTNRVSTRWPAAVPRLNRIAARALSAREYVDASYRVFCSERNVVFRECEYAVPRDAVAEVVRELRDWIEGSGEPLPFPIEVRVAAADDAWLSTAYGRPTAYVAVHQYHRLPHQRYFAAFERIVLAAGGRPHWGKLHSLGADQLAGRYPRYADFLAVRDRLDPGRAFENGYTRRVFGP